MKKLISFIVLFCFIFMLVAPDYLQALPRAEERNFLRPPRLNEQITQYSFVKPENDWEKKVVEEWKDLQNSIANLSEENKNKIESLLPIVKKITSLEPAMQKLSNNELKQKTEEFRNRLKKGEKLDDLMAEAFAVVREAFKRLSGKRLYDVQMLGGMVIHQGKIAEIKTGEGKTLVAMLPAYLRALSGQKVHIITQNDTLARIGFDETRKLYEFLGITTGLIQERGTPKKLTKKSIQEILTALVRPIVTLIVWMLFWVFILALPIMGFGIAGIFGAIFFISFFGIIIWLSGVGDLGRIQFLVNIFKVASREVERPFRKEAYQSDIVFTTPSTGFDVLQNNLPNSLLSETFAIIDEADYSMIDLNASALSLAYITGKGDKRYWQKIKKISEKLINGIDFRIEENKIFLTSEGEDKAKRLMEEENKKEENSKFRKFMAIISRGDKQKSLTAIERLNKLESVKAYLKVKYFFSQGINYLVENGEIKVIDQSTGRKKLNHRFALGVHSLLEVKENIKSYLDNHLVSLPLPIFFQLYKDKAGMTGTIDFDYAKAELKRIYNISDVVVIPTRKPDKRIDFEPKIFLNQEKQYKAIVNKIKELSKTSRPVLLATSSINESELLSAMLKKANIKHGVLNAKTEKKEIKIVKKAGKKGTVTISTSMAGRGTDIKLTKEVIDLGGLFVLSTTLSPISPRLDYQLKGRSARQGQPGQTQDFILLPEEAKEITNVNLALKEDGAVDLASYPEVFKLIREIYKEKEKQGYYHRLIHFMIDYILFRQQNLVDRWKLREAEDWREFRLWREGYLIVNNSEVYTDKGYKIFKEESLKKFENIASSKVFSKGLSVLGFFMDLGISKIDDETMYSHRRDWLEAKQKIGEKEVQVLGEINLPELPARNEIVEDNFVRELFFSIAPIFLLWGYPLALFAVIILGLGIFAFENKAPIANADKKYPQKKNHDTRLINVIEHNYLRAPNGVIKFRMTRTNSSVALKESWQKLSFSEIMDLNSEIEKNIKTAKLFFVGDWFNLNITKQSRIRVVLRIESKNSGKIIFYNWGWNVEEGYSVKPKEKKSFSQGVTLNEITVNDVGGEIDLMEFFKRELGVNLAGLIVSDSKYSLEDLLETGGFFPANKNFGKKHNRFKIRRINIKNNELTSSSVNFGQPFRKTPKGFIYHLHPYHPYKVKISAKDISQLLLFQQLSPFPFAVFGISNEGKIFGNVYILRKNVSLELLGNDFDSYKKENKTLDKEEREKRWEEFISRHFAVSQWPIPLMKKEGALNWFDGEVLRVHRQEEVWHVYSYANELINFEIVAPFSSFEEELKNSFEVVSKNFPELVVNFQKIEKVKIMVEKLTGDGYLDYNYIFIRDKTSLCQPIRDRKEIVELIYKSWKKEIFFEDGLSSGSFGINKNGRVVLRELWFLTTDSKYRDDFFKYFESLGINGELHLDRQLLEKIIYQIDKFSFAQRIISKLFDVVFKRGINRKLIIAGRRKNINNRSVNIVRKAI